jgi:hypothetical protein
MPIDLARRSEQGYDSANHSVDAQREKIEKRAYELYEQRGRKDGFHEQDWIEAENEVRVKSGINKAA